MSESLCQSLRRKVLPAAKTKIARDISFRDLAVVKTLLPKVFFETMGAGIESFSTLKIHLNFGVCKIKTTLKSKSSGNHENLLPKNGPNPDT